jgi:hypothetical protein
MNMTDEKNDQAAGKKSATNDPGSIPVSHHNSQVKSRRLRRNVPTRTTKQRKADQCRQG